ncbi:S8 family peptidase [Streptomyces sp. CC210A]|uniref:S8 family peptidase n=1 Tax=Streptomyces sp. CC210A TaxID=2898184 RepID=UPI001F31EC11|nr:S8 family peptidase [Streptomyces sp. CC210A]
MRTPLRSRRPLSAATTGVVAALALALGATTGAGAATPAADAPPAVGSVRTVPGATPVPGSYLVILKGGAVTAQAASRTAEALAGRHGGRVDKVWKDALHGFSARMSADQAARMAADPGVAYVEQDAEIRLQATQTNPPSWGIDRIDQRALPLNRSYTYDTTANNVTVYVVDTGVRTSHTEFGGRAGWGHNSIDSQNTDCNGHGTHVAGTVGGRLHGVAKGVKIVAVKVLNCAGSGTTTSLVDGVNWVAANARRPAVANLSLGFNGVSTAADNAVRAAISRGVTFVVASNNFNTDACNHSPARVAEAITVNATDSTDRRASFSNFGRCTDLFAPGVGITSAWHSGDTATRSLNGTSMAAPHVAGAAALYLTLRPAASPATVQAALITASTKNRVTNAGTGSPNRLLFTRSQTTGFTVADPGSQRSFQSDPVRLQMTASGGTTPYRWTARALPLGLTINATSGVISGAARSAGTSTVHVTATDAGGRSASVTFTWQIVREPCPTC